ncbi:LysE family translocator [Cribrihabitans pelagius]|uniref:LysE family translocator n=1 Tax=Cribrihabitans pelagius TaxID=1765746 RepID=UPI003B5C8D75
MGRVAWPRGTGRRGAAGAKQAILRISIQTCRICCRQPFFLVTVFPEPANIAVASVLRAAGCRCGLRFDAELAAGLAFWGMVAASGLDALRQSAAQVLAVLTLIGRLFLMWLAWQSDRSAHEPAPVEEAAERNGRWFRFGMSLDLSNPKAAVAGLAAVSRGRKAAWSSLLR